MSDDRIRKKRSNRHRKPDGKLTVLYMLLICLVIITFVKRREIAKALEDSRTHTVAISEQANEIENIDNKADTKEEDENSNTKDEALKATVTKEESKQSDSNNEKQDDPMPKINDETEKTESQNTLDSADTNSQPEKPKDTKDDKEQPKAVEENKEKSEEKPTQSEQKPAETKASKSKEAVNTAAIRADEKYNYSELPNKEYSWWYRVPKPLYEGIPAKIDDDIKTLIEKYDGIWQDNSGKKRVFMTFDEGYEYEDNTVRILDIAKEKDVKFTFFITGGFIKQKPELVKRMLNEGHLVANHTNKHKNGKKALDEGLDVLIDDITILENMYEELTGQKLAHFMRPPEGVYSERSLAVIKDLGYKPTFWSFAYHDWDTKAQPTHEEARKKILGQLHPGSIMLIHAVSKTNVELLPEIIDEVRAKGYAIETLDNL